MLYSVIQHKKNREIKQNIQTLNGRRNTTNVKYTKVTQGVTALNGSYCYLALAQTFNLLGLGIYICKSFGLRRLKLVMFLCRNFWAGTSGSVVPLQNSFFLSRMTTVSVSLRAEYTELGMSTEHNKKPGSLNKTYILKVCQWNWFTW